MFGMYPMGMFSGSLYSMYAPGVNVHQQLQNRYGVGYEDFGTRPYAQPYPMATVMRAPLPKCQENGFCRFIKKCFS